MLRTSEPISHCGLPHIQSQTHHKLTVWNVAASLNNVLWLDLKGSWVVNLFEIARNVALVVVFPLDEATNLVGEFRIWNVVARLVHSSLIAALDSQLFGVVEETSALVTRLDVMFGADDVQDEAIAGNFLTRLNLDNVAGLDRAPVLDLETLVPLAEDKFLDWLLVYLLSGLFKLRVVDEIQTTRGYDGSGWHENHIRKFGLLLAGEEFSQEVKQENSVVKLEQSLVKENQNAPKALNSKIIIKS